MKTRITRPTQVILLAAIIFAAFLTGYMTRSKAPETPSSNQTVAETAKSSTAEELLTLVNDERAKNGVAPLVIDPMLTESAQWKADDMKKYGYFGHVKPGETEANGLAYLDKLNNAQGRCQRIGENLTNNIHTNDSLSAVAAWIRSEPHHLAMIDPKYSLTGFGISGTKIVEHFCQQ